MKKTGKRKIGWIAGLLGIVMIVGVILSQSAVWAADTIESYAINLSEKVKDIEITAVKGNDTKKGVNSDEDNQVLFHSFFEVGEEYTIVIESGKSDYYPDEIIINKDKDTENKIIPEKQQGDGSYQFNVTIAVDQTIEVIFKEKERTDLSELITSLSGEYQGIIEEEKGSYIYKDSVKIKAKNASAVSGIGYKTKKGEVTIADTSFFELKKTTYLKELYLQDKGSGKWIEYVLDSEIHILIDKKPPEITVQGKTELWTKGDGEDIKISFEVKNESAEEDEECSDIEKVYWCKEGDSQNNELDLEGSQRYEFTVTGENKDITYWIYAVDKAGNPSEPGKVVVRCDTIPPEITNISMTSEGEIAYHTSATKSWKSITMTILAKDEGSGVGAVSLNVKDSKGSAKEIKGDKGEQNEDGETPFTFTFNSGEITEITGIVCEDNVGKDKTYNDMLDIDEQIRGDIRSNKIVVKNTTVLFDASITSDSAQAKIHVVKKGEGKEKKIIAVNSVDEDGELKISVEEEVENSVMGIQSVQVGNQEEELINTEDQTSFETSVGLDKLGLKEGNNDITVNVVMAGGQEKTWSFVILYDTVCPKIENIRVKNEQGEELTSTNFGTFYNNKVKIVVEARDDSGIDTIELNYNDGENTIKAKMEEREKGFYEYEIEAPNAPGKKEYLSFRVEATDYVGNQTEEVEVENSNIGAGRLMIENILPTVEIIYPDRAYTNPMNDCAWYNSDTDLKVVVKDLQSGLQSVNTKLNDISLDEKTNVKETIESQKEMTKEVNLTVNTGDIKKAEDGSYTLKVTAIDNAGNSESTESKKIYIDDKKPKITSFEFAAEGYKECKKTEFGVKERDYGYYFKEKTKVTVQAEDASPSSGLRSITYYTVNKDGKKSEEKTQGVSASGSITFSIPANFKGQIYAKPTDNVGHSADQFVTPDAAVIENSAQHSEDSDIVFIKKKTTKKDGKGQDLYKNDVAVTIEVSDRYSGIREVEYSVTAPYDTQKNQKGTIEIDKKGDKKKGSASGWERTGREKNLVTKLTGKIKVSHNSNDIAINVKMTDRAGHISKKRIKFSIDKTAPVIKVSYDNNKSDKGFDDFYKEKRTASVVITERNFNAELIQYTVSNKDGEVPSVDLTEAGTWRKKADKKNPDQTTYTAQIPFYEDGRYTWDISCKDRAGNKNKASDVETQEYTIDQTAPVITVTYDNVDSQNTNYYKKDRLATITIQEHNFEESRIKIKGEGRNDGKKVSFPPVSAWATQEDVHTATILYSEDAEYSFEITYTDKAGNEAVAPPEDTFVIDKTAPEINIEDVENKSANRGKMKPVVRYTDVNLDSSTVDISLRGANRGKVENEGETRDIKNGGEFTFADFKRERGIDDIYTLTVSAKDKAGNRSEEKTVYFSVNRFGSTYSFAKELSPTLAGKQKADITYKPEEFDVVLTEVNVDELQKESPQVRLTKNGTSKDLASEDYKVNYDGGGKWKKRKWSTYTYTILKSNFSEDGLYEVEVRSRDNAGNKNQTVDDKSKRPSIQFAIDKTAPVIIPIDLKSDTQYPLENKEVKIAVKDNMVTPNTKIYLNEAEVQYKTEGENCILTVPSANNKQSLRIVATDAAGNEQSVTVEDFLVSTNLFVRWYNNLPLFIGSLAVVGTLFVLAVVLLVIRRKKKKEGAN